MNLNIFSSCTYLPLFNFLPMAPLTDLMYINCNWLGKGLIDKHHQLKPEQGVVSSQWRDEMGWSYSYTPEAGNNNNNIKFGGRWMSSHSSPNNY